MDQKYVIAMGFFDGVHVGHGALLNKARERAAELGALPAVLSFDRHPDELVFGTKVPLLSDCDGREEIIQRCYGINKVFFIHFSPFIMNMPWRDFISSTAQELNAAGFVAGHDFTFGARGEGKPERLKEYCSENNISCDIIPAVKIDGRIVSSTYIRTLIENGRMEEAARFLGHPHCLLDKVHQGYHVGRKLDAPTINMFFPSSVIVPKNGVYATRAILDNGEEYSAVTNVGVRPTFGGTDTVSVESYLLGFSGDLYGRTVRVDFYSFLREERKFETAEELSGRIKLDISCVKDYFAN